MGYFTQTDLENALGQKVVKNIYDDDHDNTADAAPIAACIAYGTAQADSFIRAGYGSTSHGVPTLPLATAPSEVIFAALDFGIAYSIRRRPDIVQAMNLPPWMEYYNSAVEQMKRYCATIQRFPTDTVGTPAAAGGAVYPPDPESTDDHEPRWHTFSDFA